MADNRYVDIDYVASGYDEVQNTSWYIESDYFELGYVIQGTTHAGEAAVSAAFAVTSIAQKSRQSTATLSCSADLTTTCVKIKPAKISQSTNFNLSASSAIIRAGVSQQAIEFALTADADEINSTTLLAFANASLTAQSRVDFSAAATLATTSSLFALPLRIKPADISLSAFNTVVVVSARIRGVVVDITASSTFAASALRIFDATSYPTNRPTGVHLSNNDYFSVAPRDAFNAYNVGDGFIMSVWARFGNLQNISTTILSHMAATYEPYTQGYRAESLQIGFSKNNNFGFNVYNFGGFSGPGSRPQTVGGGGAIEFTPQAGWHHYLFRVTIWNGATGSPYSTNFNTEFYIDGVKVGDNGGTGPNGGLQAYFRNPSYIGAAQISARFENYNQTIYTDTLLAGPDGSRPTVGPSWYPIDKQDTDIKQLWIGGANTQQFNINKFYNNGFVDMGTTGTSSGLPTPEIYNAFDLTKEAVSGFTPRTYGNLTVNALATGNTQVANCFYPPGVSQSIYSGDYNPYDYQPGAHIPLDFGMVATVSAIGDNIVGFDASLSSTFSISGEFGYIFPNSSNLNVIASLTGTMTDVFPSNANLSAEFGFTANTYEFTKATATLSSEFGFTADTDEISGGEVLGPMVFALTASLGVTKPSNNNSLSGVFTISADSTTNSLATATLLMTAAIEVIPRVTYPIRPELLTMSAAFSLTSDSRRYRDSPVPLLSAFTFANGITRAVRGGNITMSAFDTVLSAGKIVEFLRENTVAVTEEQRLLRVSLESTLLLVEMANGVNSVMAENADIKVAEEQGVLLAQYNMPN